MKTKHTPSFTPGAGIARMMAFPFGPKPVLDAPNDQGAGGDDEAAKAAAEAARIAAEKEAADKAAAEAARIAKEKDDAEKAAAEKARKEAEEKAEKEKGGKLTDAERKLLHEVMERKEKQKAAEQRAAEAEARAKKYEDEQKAAKEKADKEKAEREKAEAEKAGDWERLKKMMAEEHAKEKADLVKERDALKAERTTLAQQIDDLTVGASFTGSQFVSEELVLTPTIARQVYGQNFEIENGTLVGYDKPKGAASRTKLVNGSGEPLPFDEAIKRLVESSPDKDRLLRSKLAPGARTVTPQPGTTKTAERPAAGQSGVSRIQAALAKGALAPKKKA